LLTPTGRPPKGGLCVLGFLDPAYVENSVTWVLGVLISIRD